MPSKEYIQPLFQKVAPFYDLLNNVLSLGIHWVWKKRAVKEVLSYNPDYVLDGATGTGDILSLLVEKQVKTVGLDLSSGMLDKARQKYPNQEFVLGDLTKTPFARGEFDVSVVGFGIRNVENVLEVIKELKRVSSKGIVILEFGTPENKFFQKLYFTVMRKYIPILGSFFGRREDYQYLVESSEKFISGKAFVDLVKKNIEVKNCTYKPMMGGAVYLYRIDV